MHPIKFSPNSKNPSKKEAQILFELMLCEVLMSQQLRYGWSRAVGGATFFLCFSCLLQVIQIIQKLQFLPQEKSKKHILEFSEITPILFLVSHMFWAPATTKKIEMGQEDEGSIKKMTSVNLSILGSPTFDGP